MATTTRDQGMGTGRSPAPPGPAEKPLLGTVLEMRREGPLGFYVRMWREYGDCFIHHVGRIPVYVFIHPNDVEYVVSEHEENFDKNTIIEQRARRVINQSLLMSDWHRWGHLRQVMAPPFSREEVPRFFGSLTDSVDVLLNRWRGIAERGEVIDMVDEMKLLAFSMISRFVFGEDLTQEASDGRSAITFLMGYVQNSILAVVDIPPRIPTPRNRRFAAATAELAAFIDRHIAARRQSPQGEPSDLIGYLLAGRDENYQGMTDAEIRDNVLATFIAGQQMMGLTLSWCWYHLSQDPTLEEKLHAELANLPAQGALTHDDLSGLDYTRRLLEETMRLYPTVWIQARTATHDDVIGGYHVPAGATVALLEYLTHRHPEFWEDPETFDPDRLLPERVQNLPRYAFFPFGGGKRKCIGNKYSVLAFLVAMSILPRHFRARLEPNHPVEPIAIVAVQPRDGLPMRLEPR